MFWMRPVNPPQGVKRNCLTPRREAAQNAAHGANNGSAATPPNQPSRDESTGPVRNQTDQLPRSANFLLHKSPLICYKQFTESSSVASRSYCLQLSGSSGI
jgi:hypothetical protein